MSILYGLASGVHASTPVCPRCAGTSFTKTDDLAHSPMANERTTPLNLSDLTKLNKRPELLKMRVLNQKEAALFQSRTYRI